MGKRKSVGTDARCERIFLQFYESKVIIEKNKLPKHEKYTKRMILTIKITRYFHLR